MKNKLVVFLSVATVLVLSIFAGVYLKYSSENVQMSPQSMGDLSENSNTVTAPPTCSRNPVTATGEQEIDDTLKICDCDDYWMGVQKHEDCPIQCKELPWSDANDRLCEIAERKAPDPSCDDSEIQNCNTNGRCENGVFSNDGGVRATGPKPKCTVTKKVSCTPFCPSYSYLDATIKEGNR